ncbi:hypothetical protein NO263_09125 [Gluconacetobacter entanii]|uniref:Secreted protein n=1 Tax=Gluconacetobacter entanii TaxID=108528 RepID=A0ABT3K5Q2_9PROT|nr:hypothetical protein [Gluconacetobacter entanii]MCE2578747.1 hypothetical protein [Komagataeibacter sp. FNDCR1]MCW4590742.1 hypothetical protein [Gluconacetobacter entanii]MCW4594211.1 hypothetical protein [Gluconacetobacter entanii]NPC89029.1 hypothetical protein [Gluconacetobacter entanii]
MFRNFTFACLVLLLGGGSVHAATVQYLPGPPPDPHHAHTRFGDADTSSGMLSIAGQQTLPRAAGNGSLFVEKIGQVGDTDFLLLTSTGNALCPASYSIVRVDSSGIAIPTAFFGNCNDHHEVQIVHGQDIAVIQPEFTSSEADTPRTITVYSNSTRRLAENGTPLRAGCPNNLCDGL